MSEISSACSGTSSYMTPEICIICSQMIFDKYFLRISQDSVHEQCAMCCLCGCPLSDKCYMKHGQLFCKSDYYSCFSLRCFHCMEVITPDTNVMKTFNRFYHIKCFSCTICLRSITPGDMVFVTDNGIFCQNDYELRLQHNIEGATTDSISEYEEENFDDSDSDSNKNCKRPRTILTTSQRRRFKTAFEMNPKPTRKIRETLASETSLNVRVVQVWFQNQRAKVKKLARRQAQEQQQQQSQIKSTTKLNQNGSSFEDNNDINEKYMNHLNLLDCTMPLNISQDHQICDDPMDKLYSMQESYFK